MKLSDTNNRGFTLAEILIVIAILGIAIGAIFSLYITQLKNAYVQDETIEMQQNLRMAMESISSSLKNAGTLVPLATPIIDSTFGNWSSSVTINTASADGVYARVTRAKTRSTAFVIYSTVVDASSGFGSGDKVRLIKPLNDVPVFASYTTLLISGTPTGQSLKIIRNGSVAFATGEDVANGDMFAKAASLTASGAFDVVQFYLFTGGSCPLNKTCLARSTNGTADIIASYISKLRFSYVYENGTEDTAPPSSALNNTIRAVRVTLDGTAATSTGPKNKQLTSLIMLRNKR